MWKIHNINLTARVIIEKEKERWIIQEKIQVAKTKICKGSFITYEKIQRNDSRHVQRNQLEI